MSNMTTDVKTHIQNFQTWLKTDQDPELDAKVSCDSAFLSATAAYDQAHDTLYLACPDDGPHDSTSRLGPRTYGRDADLL